MSLTLTPAELREVTRYELPSRQLAELHRQGFYRARLARDGSVILERAHYQAVCSGAAAPANAPKLRLPRLRTA